MLKASNHLKTWLTPPEKPGLDNISSEAWSDANCSCPRTISLKLVCSSYIWYILCFQLDNHASLPATLVDAYWNKPNKSSCSIPNYLRWSRFIPYQTRNSIWSVWKNVSLDKEITFSCLDVFWYSVTWTQTFTVLQHYFWILTNCWQECQNLAFSNCAVSNEMIVCVTLFCYMRCWDRRPDGVPSDIPAKMAKMWILSGQLPSWLAIRAGHGPDGSTPHQCRWADVVWAPCCHDCVMGCCGVLVVFHWPLVARGSHILHLGLGLLRARLLGLCCTAAFPLIFLQLRKGPL